MHSANRFSRAFYRSISPRSLRAAESIAPLLNRYLAATSVVDFGCGTGTWLKAFRANGALSLLGLDQLDPSQAELAIRPEEYRRVDLTRDLPLERSYDLALCLEVGEHLPPAASRTLVRNLVRASRRVVFSAATPGQGGVDHVNERPLEHWVALFADEGYAASDFIRAALAAEKAISAEPWYRYNTLFFFHPADGPALPAYVLQHLVADPGRLSACVPFFWRLRCALVGLLPVPAATFLANCKHNLNSLLKYP